MKLLQHKVNGSVDGFGDTAANSGNAIYGRIAELLEASVRLQMAPVLDRELADPKMRELYDATGSVPAAELAKSLHMSASTVCAAWKRWGELGLLVKDGKSYRRVI